MFIIFRFRISIITSIFKNGNKTIFKVHVQHVGAKATAKELQRARNPTSEKFDSWSESCFYTIVLQLHGPPGARRRRLAGTAGGGNFCPQNPFLSSVFPENKEKWLQQ